MREASLADLGRVPPPLHVTQRQPSATVSVSPPVTRESGTRGPLSLLRSEEGRSMGLCRVPPASLGGLQEMGEASPDSPAHQLKALGHPGLCLDLLPCEEEATVLVLSPGSLVLLVLPVPHSGATVILLRPPRPPATPFRIQSSLVAPKEALKNARSITEEGARGTSHPGDLGTVPRLGPARPLPSAVDFASELIGIFKHN